jgi:hydroxymethylbilane synthase
VLVSARFLSLEELPPGAVVGTGSLRRQAQLRHSRPDLQYIEFRGNVDTRLRKLGEGKADAIILAAAGLDRLEKTDWIRQRFPSELLCPAAGQGALAIECRAGDAETHAAVAPLDDPETRAAVTAERRFLAALGGGCQLPIGAYAHPVQDGLLSLRGVVAAVDGGSIVSGEAKHADPRILGDQLAKQLLETGADHILGLKVTDV